MARMNYKPRQPSVRCPVCGRLITSAKGLIKPHQPIKDAKASAPSCKGSNLPISAKKGN